ncbi:Pyridoxal phosphate homeostasis protein [bioreactor metagenome]|uniref:Pyridoxal phosphate homeostasis protein n=1 Tax=bioreactor metagenome TaxID=1076179 RepID=A0A645FGC4_9ZZZZ
MEKDLLHLPAIVVAVSKNRTKEDICRLYDQGFCIFGENRVQELLTKIDIDRPVVWHLIGHLQSNKVRSVVTHCALIHSVDSYKLLTEINKEASKQNKISHVLIQVNIAEEDTKFGIPAQELIPLVKQAAALDHILIQGIMVIGPHTEDQARIQTVFTAGKNLFDQLHEINQANLQPSYLSMGMSHDYETALACGSNMVRLGTLLFTTY